MTLHALQDVGDAVDVTNAFLRPFDLRRWLKLALVAFFVGGGANVPPTGFDTSVPPEQLPEPGTPVTFPEGTLLAVGAVVAIVVLVGLAWGLVSSILEFAFVESLRTGDVTLRRYWRARWRQGVRLFGFRIAIGIPALLLIGGWLVAVFAPLLTGADPVVPMAVLLVGIPLFFVVGLVFGLLNGFTTAFVVPIMILDDCGVLAGWRRLWASIAADWKQYLAYAVLNVVLLFALGVAVSVALGLAAVALLLPAAVAAVAIYVTVSFSSTVGLVGLGIVAVAFATALVVLWALLQVPVVTFLRYYALLVLGDVDDELDLIPDRRTAVRTDG